MHAIETGIMVYYTIKQNCKHACKQPFWKLQFIANSVFFLVSNIEQHAGNSLLNLPISTPFLFRPALVVNTLAWQASNQGSIPSWLQME